MAPDPPAAGFNASTGPMAMVWFAWWFCLLYLAESLGPGQDHSARGCPSDKDLRIGMGVSFENGEGLRHHFPNELDIHGPAAGVG